MTPTLQIFARYLRGLADHPGWALAALAVALAFAATLWLRRPHHRRVAGRIGRRWPPPARAYWTATAGFATVAVALSIQRGWVADDAFISFRYARNWANGEGVVYNPGEHVEGYTNFLWVALLAPFEAAGLPLPQVALALNGVCQVTTLALTSWLAWRLWDREPRPMLSLATALLAFNYVFSCFGSSGLETMLGACLVLWSMERVESGRPLAAGALGIAATMTHPDHAIFFVATAGAYLTRRSRWRDLTRFSLPFFAAYVPYFAWRYSYYGDFFPNTYYAKNAYLTYFVQGARYLWMSGLASGLCIAFPLAAFGVIRFWSRPLSRIVAIATPLFLLYVAKIGGDFMLGRLLLPLMPPLYLLAELAVRDLAARSTRRARVGAAAALSLACAAAVPSTIVRPMEKYLHVADERTFYSVASLSPFSIASRYWRDATTFDETFAKLSRWPTLAIGAHGIVGYRTGVRVVDNYGLVNRDVAHWRTRRRTRPGHEKLIGPGLLVESPADFSDIAVFPEPYHSLGKLKVGPVDFHVVHYEKQLFAELRRAGVRLPKLAGFLESYRPPRGPDSHERLACDLWYLDHVYFRNQLAPRDRARILEQVVERRPELDGFESLLLGELPQGDDARWQRLHEMTFDEWNDAWQVEGEAFVDNPARGPRAGQHHPSGVRGGFLNTFGEADEDRARGRLTTESFEIVGDVLTLDVGGGYHPRNQYVELLVDGRRWFRATGCDSEILARHAWVTRSLRGSQAQLTMVDAGNGAWGHLLVDSVVQWRRREPADTEPPNDETSADNVLGRSQTP